MKNHLLLGTRKGLIVCHRKSGGWKIGSVHFEGIPVSLAWENPLDGTWWACLDHGHWGVKMHRSTDRGANWQEVAAPAFPEGKEIKEGVPATTQYLWAMSHGGADHPNRLWVGTIPGGLFLSEDNGDSFQLVESLWNHPSRSQWFGGGFDHPGIDAIFVDPRNSDRLLVSVSCGGVFESTDGGKSWQGRNKGLRADFLPDPHAEYGHDPHMMVAAPTNPDVLWQQNHCGIFRSVDGAKTWADVSEKDGPAKFGFAMAVADDKPDQAWWCLLSAISTGWLWASPSASAARTMAAKAGRPSAMACPRKTPSTSCIAMPWLSPATTWCSAPPPATCSSQMTGEKAGRCSATTCPWCIRWALQAELNEEKSLPF